MPIKAPKVSDVKRTLDAISWGNEVDFDPFKYFHTWPTAECRERCLVQIRRLTQNENWREFDENMASWFENTALGLFHQQERKTAEEILSIYLFAKRLSNPDEKLLMRAVRFILANYFMWGSHFTLKIICNKVAKIPPLYHSVEEVQVFLQNYLERPLKWTADHIFEGEEIETQHVAKVMLAVLDTDLISLLEKINAHLEAIKPEVMKGGKLLVFAKIQATFRVIYDALQAKMLGDNVLLQD